MRHLIITILSFCSISATSQSNLIVPSDGRYLYQDREYEFSELRSIYAGKPELLKLDAKGRKLIRIGNVSTYVGFGMLAAGGALYFSSSSDNFHIAAFLTFGVGVLLEVLANIPRVLGYKKVKKVMRKFNLEVIERQGYNTITSISTSKTHIGFVLKF